MIKLKPGRAEKKKKQVNLIVATHTYDFKINSLRGSKSTRVFHLHRGVLNPSKVAASYGRSVALERKKKKKTTMIMTILEGSTRDRSIPQRNTRLLYIVL